MEKPPTRPSTWRSSGMNPTPASRTCRTDRPTSCLPSSVTEPSTWSWRPRSASVSSVWPLPWTPATASTSPARDAEADAVEVDRGRARRRTRRSWTTSASSPRLGASLWTISSTGRPTMSAASSALRGGRLGLADDRAAADHRDPVGDRADLAQLVGDEDDRLAGLLELAHDLHQLVGLLGRQHRGRLVEDQHLRVTRQRLDDLDPLLDADRQVLDDRVGVDVEAEPLGDLAHALTRGVECRACRRTPSTRCRA